jgi:hypothetical protein
MLNSILDIILKNTQLVFDLLGQSLGLRTCTLKK